MGQLNKTFEDLNQNLRELEKEDLQSNYSPEEIAEFILKDIKN